MGSFVQVLTISSTVPQQLSWDLGTIYYNLPIDIYMYRYRTQILLSCIAYMSIFYTFFLSVSVSVNEEMQTFADSHNVTFGANLTLLCTHEQGTDVKWYFDTKQLYKEVVNSNFESRLSLIFSQSGVYRCELTTNGVSSGVRRVTLCGVGKTCVFLYQ